MHLVIFFLFNQPISVSPGEKKKQNLKNDFQSLFFQTNYHLEILTRF